MSLVNYFTEGEFLSIESDKAPGIIKRYLVDRVIDQRTIKLIFQDEYYPDLGPKHLVRYMHDNHMTQQILAEVLSKSRSAISRYINGQRSIPKSVFDSLGIKSHRTDIQKDIDLQKIAMAAVDLRDALNKTITLIEEA